MLHRAYEVQGAVALAVAWLATAQAATWVPIQGTVRLQNGTAVCAMVLANGQYTFSCDGSGAYSLNVPLDPNGEITLFSFADGFAPFSTTLAPASFPFGMQMEAAAPRSPLIAMTHAVVCADTPDWVHITGTIESVSSQPLCALVLANGHQMFSCNDSLGRYDLMVPTAEGRVTIFGFAEGFQPYRETFQAPTCGGRHEMLDLVNTARRQGRQCGNEGYFPPTETLNWNDLLADAAMRHSSDMATHDYFSHAGLDNSQVSDRVSATGYDWWTVGENIAAGYTTPAAAVQALLESPGHCANIMNPNFMDFGAARSDNPNSAYGVYWAQVFGARW